MSMWKVIIAPVEDVSAWDNFKELGIIAIGWCCRSMDKEKPVLEFRKIKPGDWIVAHLPADRSGQTFLAVGIGKVVSDYEEVIPNPSEEWEGSFRRQFKVNWISTQQIRLPDLFRMCNYRTTVCRLKDDVAKAILQRYDM